MREISIGMLAHVDAGKTTLTEALLYESEKIRDIGRVDYGTSHMDTDRIERERGITVFSKQAVIERDGTRISLIDTPGHAELVAETERTLPVLDYAVLVISASEPIQAHTLTLRKLLERYRIPCFLFITKCDLPNRGKKEIMKELRESFHKSCIDFSDENFMEDLVLKDEDMLERYLSGEEISDKEIAKMIQKRELFPCFFGSALKMQGIREFSDLLYRYTLPAAEKSAFAARVFKICRDEKGGRITFMKITGGSLHPRDIVACHKADGEVSEEKVTELRLYSGNKYTQIREANAGLICAVLGLTDTFPGMGIGAESNSFLPTIEPFMQYSILPTDGTDPMTLHKKLTELSEENPEMEIRWNPQNAATQLRLMGIIQKDVLQSKIKERFSIETQIGEAGILYLESIQNEVEGIGHYEPLRHFAEVHLLLRPLPRGEGIHFHSECDSDRLSLNWQRLILSHIAEKKHLGVLTGSPITDMEIILKSGKDHIKHTDGGDFRQATYRAIRQGLMKAKSLLLEPFVSFDLTVPQEQIGRAIQDLQMLYADFSSPELSAFGEASIRGTAPAVTLQNYEESVRAYTRGKGRFSFQFSHYAPCHNEEEVIRAFAYNPEADLDNSPDSVFCDHGAGNLVKWNEVEAHMSLPSVLAKREIIPPAKNNRMISDRELEAIMEREFGPIYRKQYASPIKMPSLSPAKEYKAEHRILIIDGYNLLYAIPGLDRLAEEDLSYARELLIQIVENYAAYDGSETLLVFDAYKVKEGRGSEEFANTVKVIYTKESETADAYIESYCHRAPKSDRLRLVTSDALIQLSALRAGVQRISSREFSEELKAKAKEMQKYY